LPKNALSGSSYEQGVSSSPGGYNLCLLLFACRRDRQNDKGAFFNWAAYPVSAANRIQSHAACRVLPSAGSVVLVPGTVLIPAAPCQSHPVILNPDSSK